jgi:ubiquinone/menaquinone biosynthesis C-methylase UbiE
MPIERFGKKGDFTQIAAAMRESGEALVGRIGIGKGMKVLDLGCGDGSTALPAAEAGAEVLGVDIARNLVQAGNRRASELGLANLRFRESDAAKLDGLADGSFDLVISIFGAMFAPRPHEVAREMLRVTQPGGHIVMGNWIPGNPTLVAQILKISSAFTPAPPAGFVSPMTWGLEEHVIERFVNAGIVKERIKFERDTFLFQAATSPAKLLNIFRNYYDPTMNAYDAAEKNGRAAELHRDLALFNSQNRSPVKEFTSIPATFLRVTVEV